MGAVYRATDTRLGREVALKIVPEKFARDRQRMGRFQREAEVLASLDHPNISTIHGLEVDGDVQALVLELVEGPTLAERIAKGPIPTEEALGMALEIAQIVVHSLESGEQRVLLENGSDARYVPTGHLVFAREATLIAVPFDLATLSVTGPEVPVLEDVNHALYTGHSLRETGAAQFAFSDSGTLAYIAGSVYPEYKYRVVRVDRKGAVERLEGIEPGSYFSVRLSLLRRSGTESPGKEASALQRPEKLITGMHLSGGEQQLHRPGGECPQFCRRCGARLRGVATGSERHGAFEHLGV